MMMSSHPVVDAYRTRCATPAPGLEAVVAEVVTSPGRWRSISRRGRSGSKQACRLGNHALHDCSRRGQVIDKVDSLTGDHRGNVEVAGLAGRGVPRCLLLDLLQQADL